MGGSDKMAGTEICVEFNIIGDYFQEEEISNVLELIPSEFYRKGDAIKNRTLARKETCWTISSGFEESLDINEQIKKILYSLQNKSEELNFLKKELNLDYLLTIIINVQEENVPAMYFESNVLGFINNISAEIEVDLYIFS